MMEKKEKENNNLKFIHLYRSHPILWNMKAVSEKQKKLKTNIYIEIAREMGSTVETVRKKIRSLCTSFASEKRKMEKALTTNISSSEGNTQYSPTYKWFYELSFLDSVYCGRKTESTLIEDEQERKRRLEEAESSEDSAESNVTYNKKQRKDKQQTVDLDLEGLRFKSYHHIKRYMVQIPKSLLTIKTADVQELNQRYPSLGIPTDFFLANIKWSDFLTPEKPFSIKRPCQFHIMHDMLESPTKNSQTLEPADANCLYSAKVMLLSLPPIYEIYRKCFDNSADKTHCAIHPWRLIKFLVGVEGDLGTMAIGGPWSASLDGENPDNDPAVLIRTAIRTCKALTGINLSSCTQWYRFVEIYYHRQDGREEDDYVETVVIYLPDVHSVMPNIAEWQILLQVYKNTVDVGDKSQYVERADDSKLNKQTAIENSVNKKSTNDATPVVVIDDKMTDEATTDCSISSADGEEIGDKSSNDKYSRKPSPFSKLVSYKSGKSGLPKSPHIIVRPNRQAKGGKFECVVKSMSVLLDYHPDDFKESSFEISLFVELFNDMLIRDFGFKIYKEINLLRDSEATTLEKEYMQIKEEEEEFIDCDEETKSFQVLDDYKIETDQTHIDAQVIELRTSNLLEIDKTIINPQLLLSFIYFDTSQCGYITGKDLEDLFYVLGINLTRSDIRNLLQKLKVYDSSGPMHYRKLTHMSELLEPGQGIEVVNMANVESTIESEADSDEDSTYILSSEDSASHTVSTNPSSLSEKEIALALVDEYSKLPQLLNTTIEEVYNYKRKEKEKLYKTLANNLNARLQLELSFNLVKRKLTFICNLYENEIKHRLTEHKETNAASQWLYENMNFLQPVIENKLKLKMSNRKYLTKPLDDHRLYDLIDIYKNYKGLWDTNHLTFFDREKRDEMMVSLLDEIKAKMNIFLDVNQLQDQLNHLHKSYSKDKRFRIACEINQKDFHPTFPCFYKCHFLESYEGPFKCSKCNLITETYCQYEKHKTEHEGAKCSECGKEYKIVRLRSHIKKHKKKPFPSCKFRCKFCPERFASHQQLDLHMQSHKRLCNLCGTSFSYDKPFIDHMKRHEEKHKYFCHICQEGFFLKISLNNHIKHHVEINDKICDICDKTFIDSLYLYRHKERVHGIQFGKKLLQKSTQKLP